MADVIEHATKSLPAFVYDLVARICPGGFFIITLVAGQRPDLDVTRAFGDAGAVVVLIGVSYVVGILLNALGALLFDVPLEIVSRLIPNARVLSPNALWDELDQIDKISQRHASILFKIEAEATLCQNLFAAFVALIVLRSWGYLPHAPSLIQLSNPLTWLLGLVILGAAIHRTAVIFRRLRSFRHVLGCGTFMPKGGAETYNSQP